MNRREIVEGWSSKLRGSVRFDSCVAVRFFGKIMNRNDDAIKISLSNTLCSSSSFSGILENRSIVRTLQDDVQSFPKGCGTSCEYPNQCR
jgi:hypothetical protein